MSRTSGKKAQLPTEAQWEYARRAGTKTRFYSGDSDGDLDGVAWYASNSGHTTHPVGEKEPNTWGLYDMHGNVCEWCADRHGKYGGTTAIDPQGPATGDTRAPRRYRERPRNSSLCVLALGRPHHVLVTQAQEGRVVNAV
ncbi:MAG: formylglycine-generating enzyme family protein [Planctomycetota bacterium]